MRTAASRANWMPAAPVMEVACWWMFRMCKTPTSQPAAADWLTAVHIIALMTYSGACLLMDKQGGESEVLLVCDVIKQAGKAADGEVLQLGRRQC